MQNNNNIIWGEGKYKLIQTNTYFFDKKSNQKSPKASEKKIIFTSKVNMKDIKIGKGRKKRAKRKHVKKTYGLSGLDPPYV